MSSKWDQNELIPEEDLLLEIDPNHPEHTLDSEISEPEDYRPRTNPVLRVAFHFLAIGLILLIVLTINYFRNLPLPHLSDEKIQSIAALESRDNTIFLDRNNVKIGELFTKFQIFKSFDEIPKDFINAIVATEDRRFWSHHGFDPKGILRAAVRTLQSKNGRFRQGASTITQQVVRPFFCLERKRFTEKSLKFCYL